MRVGDWYLFSTLRDKVVLCSPGWLRTPYVLMAGVDRDWPVMDGTCLCLPCTSLVHFGIHFMAVTFLCWPVDLIFRSSVWVTVSLVSAMIWLITVKEMSLVSSSLFWALPYSLPSVLARVTLGRGPSVEKMFSPKCPWAVLIETDLHGPRDYCGQSHHWAYAPEWWKRAGWASHDEPASKQHPSWLPALMFLPWLPLMMTYKLYTEINSLLPYLFLVIVVLAHNRDSEASMASVFTCLYLQLFLFLFSNSLISVFMVVYHPAVLSAELSCSPCSAFFKACMILLEVFKSSSIWPHCWPSVMKPMIWLRLMCSFASVADCSSGWSGAYHVGLAVLWLTERCLLLLLSAGI